MYDANVLTQLQNSRILITGATGLIGQTVIKKLLSSVPQVHVFALVRDRNKAVKLFGEETDKLHFIVSDVNEFTPKAMEIDYIIHGASVTSSKYFVEYPVETSRTALQGSINMLETAWLSKVRGFLYLSSMEVYGTPLDDKKITEETPANLNAMRVRSSYPESKRMCENLCVSYAAEYGVPAKVIRLTQSFGPGVSYNDGRVFAEFARAVIEGRNIVLHTKGKTKRNYLYTEDAADAILTVLTLGEPGQAYNAANEDTYCSVYEMACFVAEKIAGGAIAVEVHESDAEKLGYAPELHMNLDTTKLQALGWKPQYNLQEMFEHLVKDMRRIRG